MCRLLGYLGTHVILDDLFYRSDSALARQVYDPAMQGWLNLAGAGFMAWDDQSSRSELPYSYHTTELPMYDRNLQSLAEKIFATCLLAHIRATAYLPGTRGLVSNVNLHPFRFPNVRVALAHNGALADFDKMKFALAAACRPDMVSQVNGTTDSEWMYALLLSKLDDPYALHPADELAHAVKATFRTLRDIRLAHGIHTHSAANLIVSNGECLVATRFSFDLGCYDSEISGAVLNPTFHNLYYTVGSEYGLFDGAWGMKSPTPASSVLLASEPLTDDHTEWVEVHEYSILQITKVAAEVEMSISDLDV